MIRCLQTVLSVCNKQTNKLNKIQQILHYTLEIHYHRFHSSNHQQTTKGMLEQTKWCYFQIKIDKEKISNMDFYFLVKWLKFGLHSVNLAVVVGVQKVKVVSRYDTGPLIDSHAWTTLDIPNKLTRELLSLFWKELKNHTYICWVFPLPGKIYAIGSRCNVNFHNLPLCAERIVRFFLFWCVRWLSSGQAVYMFYQFTRYFTQR